MMFVIPPKNEHYIYHAKELMATAALQAAFEGIVTIPH
jgi:hypothetical protein